MTPEGFDPDAVVRAVLACPDVAAMSEGALAEAASYLPGRRVPGVRAGEDGLAVHIVARWGRPLPDVGETVRAAVAPLAAGLPVTVYVDDIEAPGVAAASQPGPVAGAAR